MEKLITVVGAGILGFLIIAGFSMISGTLIWLIWDSTIPYIFPTLASANYITSHISWWQAVGLSWICGVLIKGHDHRKE